MCVCLKQPKEFFVFGHKLLGSGNSCSRPPFDEKKREKRNTRDERRKRTYSRRRTDSSHGLVKSPYDVGYRREARSSTGGRKSKPILQVPFALVRSFATNKLSVVGIVCRIETRGNRSDASRFLR